MRLVGADLKILISYPPDFSRWRITGTAVPASVQSHGPPIRWRDRAEIVSGFPRNLDLFDDDGIQTPPPSALAERDAAARLKVLPIRANSTRLSTVQYGGKYESGF